MNIYDYQAREKRDTCLYSSRAWRLVFGRESGNYSLYRYHIKNQLINPYNFQ